MTQNTPALLYLLVPWELPIEQQLSEENKVRVQQILQQLLHALDLSSPRESLRIVDRELADIDVSHISPATVSSTQTSLKPGDVEDFNRYFKLTHVQTKEPAICLVLSLLSAYQTFLTIEESKPQLDSLQVESLKDGLRSYAYLLARVFSLSL